MIGVPADDCASPASTSTPHGGGAPRVDRLRPRLPSRAAGVPPCTCSRRRAARCATTKRSASFVPEASPLPIFPAGSVRGSQRRRDRRSPDGGDAARRALARAGAHATRELRSLPDSPRCRSSPPALGRLLVEPLWAVSSGDGGKRFVDLQNDVTVRDIALAAREGYQRGRAPEALHDARHGHRPGQDQQRHRARADGASSSACPIPQVGTTTFRPPYTPVTLGAFPGHGCGAHVAPTRHTAMHDWHAEQGARFVNAGLWKRPHSYPRAGESEDDAANREARNVRAERRRRRRVDAGQDRAAGTRRRRVPQSHLHQSLGQPAVGRCRYGVMLRDDGLVPRRRHDVAARRHALPDDDDHRQRRRRSCSIVERLLQVDWPDLDVYATSVTEQLVGGGAVRTRSRATSLRRSSTSTSRTPRFRSSPSRRATSARRKAAFRRVCSG